MEPGRGHAQGQRHLFGCQDLFSKELETRPNHCWGGDGAQGLPPLPLGPSPSPCWWGQGSRRPWSAVGRGPHLGAGLPRQARDCLDKRLGAAWLTVRPWEPDTWGVPTGVAWPEWGQSSARLVPGPPQSSCSPGQPAASPLPRTTRSGASHIGTCRGQTSVLPEVQKQTRLMSINCSITGPLVLNRECLVIF